MYDCIVFVFYFCILSLGNKTREILQVIIPSNKVLPLHFFSVSFYHPGLHQQQLFRQERQLERCPFFLPTHFRYEFSAWQQNKKIIKIFSRPTHQKKHSFNFNTTFLFTFRKETATWLSCFNKNLKHDEMTEMHPCIHEGSIMSISVIYLNKRDGLTWNGMTYIKVTFLTSHSLTLVRAM